MPSLTPLDYLVILHRLRTFLHDPSVWIKHEFALDSEGYAVDPRSPEACSWCLSGAILCVTYETELPCEPSSLSTEIHRLFDSDIATFNDDPTTTHSDILSLIDRTIAGIRQR